MSQKVDLYDSAYGNYESDGYRLVRIETYGEDPWANKLGHN